MNISFEAPKALADISMLYLHQQEEGESSSSQPDAAGLSADGMERIAPRGDKIQRSNREICPEPRRSLVQSGQRVVREKGNAFLCAGP